jgi:hypothetical protein
MKMNASFMSESIGQLQDAVFVKAGVWKWIYKLQHCESGIIWGRDSETQNRERNLDVYRIQKVRELPK